MTCIFYYNISFSVNLLLKSDEIGQIPLKMGLCFISLQGACEIHFKLWFMFFCAPTQHTMHFETIGTDLRCFTCVKEHHFYMFYWQYASNWAHSCFQPGNLYGQCEQISFISIHYLVLLAAGKPVTSSSHWEIGIFIVMVWLTLKK